MKIFTEIKHIFIGWYRYIFGIQIPESERRMQICNKCPHNDDNWCDICGCYLPSKTRVEDEICHDNR